MESNNYNYGQGEQLLRKRKFNVLANDDHGQPAAAGGEEQQYQAPDKLSKNKKNCSEQQGNDALENLHLESLTREELIQFVQKQLANKNEAHNKQLEAVKKEAEESAKQQAKEMTTKMEELKQALLASQLKVEQLTAEMATQLNVEHQKHLDSAKQAELAFFQRIIQSEQKYAEVHEDLRQNLTKIVEMHKEIDKKSEEVAEKAKHLDALLIQLNESTSHQHQHQLGLPTEQQMKIQLSLETWYDLLAFVPRHRLGKFVPNIGDRKFAGIVQPFLHNYQEITLGNIRIFKRREYAYAYDGPGLEVYPKFATYMDEPWRTLSIALILPDVEMPANVKDFACIQLSYLNYSVIIDFLQKFQQNSLFGNVNLYLPEDKMCSMESLQEIFSYILPLIDNINSIQLTWISQLKFLYEVNFEWTMALMRMPQILNIKGFGHNYFVEPEKFEHLNRWLHMSREDGKPRVLILPSFYIFSLEKFSNLINRIIKLEFSEAKSPCSFFIRLFVLDYLKWPGDICMENEKTKEKLVVKKGKSNAASGKYDPKMALISRYPLNVGKQWIEANEQEVLNWDFDGQNGRIYVDNPIW